MFQLENEHSESWVLLSTLIDFPLGSSCSCGNKFKWRSRFFFTGVKVVVEGLKELNKNKYNKNEAYFVAIKTQKKVYLLKVIKSSNHFIFLITLENLLFLKHF